jgi:hypothetical protein
MPEEAVEVLRALWSAEDKAQAKAELDEACGPQKSCKNMKDVSFDGFAEPGSDVGAAWRSKLAREGKLVDNGTSLRDLVLGSARDQ